MARDILNSMNIFSENEIEMISQAIYNHSDKSVVHSPLDELLKDADVMQHVLYNPFFEIKSIEQSRYSCLMKELDL